MSDKKFPPRCYLDPTEFTMECEDFAAVAQLKLTGIADVQYLSLTEHQRLMAEKDKRIERLMDCLLKLKHLNNHKIEEEMWRIDAALQEDGK